MVGRALVVRLDSAGDVLLAGPAVRAIASTCEVVMLCGPQGAPAARILPGVSEVFVWECPWIAAPAPEVSSPALAPLMGFLRGGNFTECVVLTSFHQSPLPLALLLRLAGIPRIAGASVDYAGSLLDIRLKPGEDFPEDQPEPHRALAIARAAGHALPGNDPGTLAVLPPPPATELVGYGPYVVVHPGASVPARAWPPGHHADLVQRLAAAGHRVVVTGGPSEKALTAAVAGDRAVDLGGQTDLGTLSGVLAGAGVVVTGNTGPAHLAAAVGTPVVSLFSPVVPAERWAPYGVPVELLGDQDAACRGTRARDCPVPGHPCLSSVTPQQVVAAVDRLLAGNGSPGQQAPLERTAP